MPYALFGLGVLAIALVAIGSLGRGSDTKPGVVSLPFALFAAAAVAKYLGL